MTAETINGQRIKITRAGYLYVDGVRVSELECTPLNLGAIAPKVDADVARYAAEWAARHYVMCRP